MISLKCYQFPNGVFDGINKPSYSCYNQGVFSLSDNLGFFNPIEAFNLDTLIIQGSFTENFNNFDNLNFPNVLLFENDKQQQYFYQIVNIRLIQQTNSTYELEIKLDYYLTYLGTIFNPQDVSNVCNVYFKRKHLQSGLYYQTGTNNTFTTIDGLTFDYANGLNYVYDPMLCFWINNIDEDLIKLSNSYTYENSWKRTNLAITDTGTDYITGSTYTNHYPFQIQIASNSLASTLGIQQFMSQFYNFNNYGSMYLYALFKGNLATDTNYAYDTFANAILLCPLSNNFNYDGLSLSGNPLQATQNNMNLGMSITDLFTQYSKEYYVDILALPGAITEFCLPKNDFELYGNDNIWKISNLNALSDFIKNPSATNLNTTYVLKSTNEIYVGRWYDYLRDKTNPITSGNQIEKDFYSFSILNSNGNLEAVLFNEAFFYSKIRLGNMEQIVNGNDFRNIYLTTGTYTGTRMYDGLFNFKILINYPNINIVNIPYSHSHLSGASLLNWTGETMDNEAYPTLTLQQITNEDTYFKYNGVNLYTNYQLATNTSNPPSVINNVYLPSIPNSLPNNGKLDLNYNLLFNFEGRNTYPSESNNWLNYQANYHNQYELGRNLGILDMVMSGVSGAFSLIPMMGTNQALSAVSGFGRGMTESLPSIINYQRGSPMDADGKFSTINPFRNIYEDARNSNMSSIGFSNANISGALSPFGSLIGDAMKYYYKYDGGMKSDYSRVANLQGSQSMNPNILNCEGNYQEKQLTPYAKKIVLQRYMNFGYVLNRYNNFYYGYNRTHGNYIEINDFMSVYAILYGNTVNNTRPFSVPRLIVDALNTMLAKGIRIIEYNALDTASGDIMGENGETNYVVNQNNNEVEYLINETKA